MQSFSQNTPATDREAWRRIADAVEAEMNDAPFKTDRTTRQAFAIFVLNTCLNKVAVALELDILDSLAIAHIVAHVRCPDPSSLRRNAGGDAGGREDEEGGG